MSFSAMINSMRSWQFQQWLSSLLFVASPLVCVYLYKPWDPIPVCAACAIFGAAIIVWSFSWQAIVTELRPIRFRPLYLSLLAVSGVLVALMSMTLLSLQVGMTFSISAKLLFCVVSSCLVMLFDIPLQLDQLSA